MSHPKPPVPAKLIIGMITRDKELALPVADRLADAFGDIDMISPWFAFDDTNYYEPEMGTGLSRRMLAFKHLVDQDGLGGIKINTNAIENEFLNADKRRVNIDPGLLTHERFVLATGKNFTHRIYIGSHVYADLTLIYQRGRFQPLPWTYPDYRRENMQDYLIRVRRKYSTDLKTAKA
jgi:hypothetical protein